MVERLEVEIARKPLTAAMDNVLAWRMGEAFSAAAKETAGDPIDRGLALLHYLNDKGFDVFTRAREGAPHDPQ
jgi:hypothetical protein